MKKMKSTIKSLPKAKLYKHCRLNQFKFRTSNDLPDLKDALGQERAMAALEFGLEMQREGYNLYALGPVGVGKHDLLRNVLQTVAAAQPTPEDWCYVTDFDNPLAPQALNFPAGQAEVFCRSIQGFIEDLTV